MKLMIQNDRWRQRKNMTDLPKTSTKRHKPHERMGSRSSYCHIPTGKCGSVWKWGILGYSFLAILKHRKWSKLLHLQSWELFGSSAASRAERLCSPASSHQAFPLRGLPGMPAQELCDLLPEQGRHLVDGGFLKWGYPWSKSIGFSIINHPFWGSPICGTPHVFLFLYQALPARSSECTIWECMGPAAHSICSPHQYPLSVICKYNPIAVYR